MARPSFLSELHIRQFALIDRLDLAFAPGASALTGETGAGKSIVVDALGALFGARARADWVRHGAERAEISGVVTLAPDCAVNRWLREQQLDDGESLLLRRTITADGRSRAWINGTPSPLKQLQQLGALLLDLHGQHEHQALLRTEYQRRIVDDAIDPALCSATADAWNAWQAAADALKEFDETQQERAMRAAWVREQLERLQQLQPEPGIVEQLNAEADTLRHAGAIRDCADQAVTLLDGEQEPNARSLIATALGALQPNSDHHPALREAESLLAQIEPLLDEALRALQPALEIEGDPQTLDALETRIAALQEAMRLHQCDADGLCQRMTTWQEELDAQETAQWDRQQLAEACQKAETQWHDAARSLHEARAAQSERLSAALRPLLDHLGLNTMRIAIQVIQDEQVRGAHGCDRICWMASTNPGEPFRPLAEVASGGELSRIVLALKGCGALRHPAAIAVFDEVDVGIGGETAWCVGELLAAMGRDRQLFVISHLPQVAACADHQFTIGKENRDGRTTTRVTALDEAAREAEIARMLGDSQADLTRKQARAMLRRGKKNRSN